MIKEREQIETIIARLLLSNKLTKEEANALMFMVEDFHKMTVILNTIK